MRRNRMLIGISPGTAMGVIAALLLAPALTGCGGKSPSSGIGEVSADIEVNAEGRTFEQENIKRRLELENAPGSIKHLYVFSAYSGQAIFYSTVAGKVTSSGKRLTNPMTLKRGCLGGEYVLPALGEDGTYGSSIPYLYWFDAKGIYHQHYVTGGQIVHLSDQPIAVKSVILNLEISEEP